MNSQSFKPRNTERNEQIYMDRMNGMTYAKLATKYNISKERIRQIVLQQIRLIEYKALLEKYKKDIKYIEITELSFYGVIKTMNVFKEHRSQVIRGLNAFFRSPGLMHSYSESVKEVLPIFMSMTREQFLSLRSVGSETADILIAVQEELASIAKENGWLY